MENAQPSPERSRFDVMGMSCAACAVSLESTLKKIKGVETVNISFTTEKALVQFDPKMVSNDNFVKAAKSLGFSLVNTKIALQNNTSIELGETIRRKLIVSIGLTIPVFVISMIIPGKLPAENLIMMILSIPVVFYSGSSFIINSIKRLSHGTANMDTLVFLGTQSAFLYSSVVTIMSLDSPYAEHVYFESAVVIITFLLVGKYLETRSKGKAADAIFKLMSLQPTLVNVKQGENEVETLEENLSKGDLVVVRPGERLPVDGYVVEGCSSVDERTFTGESDLVAKEVGGTVKAGTMNIDGRLLIYTEKFGEDTYLSKIVEKVEEAQNSKAPIQKLADKVSAIFVPGILLIAILTFLIWWFIVPGTTFGFALNTFIAVLIIACPCALGLATPTALAVGIGRAAEKGILIKNAEALEIAALTTDVAFDKTGTLTEGLPKVSFVEWSKGLNPEEISGHLKTISSQSLHPLSKAIERYTIGELLTCSQVMNLPGQGILCTIDGKEYRLGSERWLSERTLTNSHESEALDQRTTETHSVVWFTENDSLIAKIYLRDSIRSEAKFVIDKLKEQGIKVHILTGDHNAAASQLAGELGVDDWVSDMLPEDKVDYIKQLEKRGSKVAMVGDGINDGPALALASLSVAMSSGEDLAKETSDVTLSHSNLGDLLLGMKLSKATMTKIRQNLKLAFIYNILAVPIAAGVFYPWTGVLLNPMIAGGAMALSSLSVVANSLRLRYVDLNDR